MMIGRSRAPGRTGRGWSGGGLVALRLANRRIAASSVAPIRPGMNAPFSPCAARLAAAQDITDSPISHLGARVGLEVGLAHVVGGHVRVHLGRLDAGVAEHLLNAAQVAAA